MAARNSGALVVGYRREDRRRHVRDIPYRVVQAGGVRVPLLGARVRLTGAMECNRIGGRCISCGHDVYLNEMGFSAVLEKDADVCCMECEDRYSAEMTRSL